MCRKVTEKGQIQQSRGLESCETQFSLCWHTMRRWAFSGQNLTAGIVLNSSRSTGCCSWLYRLPGCLHNAMQRPTAELFFLCTGLSYIQKQVQYVCDMKDFLATFMDDADLQGCSLHQEMFVFVSPVTHRGEFVFLSLKMRK